MPIRLDDMETSNNREAEGSSFTRRSVDISDAFIDEPYQDQTGEGDELPPVEDDGGFPLTEAQLMRLVASALSQGQSYQEQTLQPRWLSAYNAFNNKHSVDSKYSSARFRGRSRLFRPKTRSTARKKQAEAAAALFSTSDVVQVRAADESNPMQLAGAELLSALLRFRLDRANENSGVPWFQISMGAHLSAQQTGLCISKQYWEYRRILEGYDTVPIEEPLPPQLAPLAQMLGKTSIVVGEERVPRYRVVRDRPRCELMPPEDVIRDPAASWEDQAQDSAYLILKFPMTVEAARAFLKDTNDKSRMRFYPVSDDTLAAAAGGATDPNNAASVRRARESNGADRFSDYAVDAAYRQVWLHENYFRIEGRDYVFWTLGHNRLISEVIPVEEAYPEQGGGRPIVIGVSALEPFKIDPMSPVESWQEMQREMNDLVNLRLDTLKQTIAPLAKVKRGRSVDIRAIQNRTPDSVVYMQDMSDVEFDRPGSVAGEAYIEMEKLNADFDDQAGNFSTGSVQTNRQLGETVGGMQMMASNANAMGEFDLRVWVETWVEPVLRQIVKLEQFYESDINVLTISAKRAKLMPRFGVSQINDEMLNAQVAISVDIGIGSSDPLITLQKFEKATQIVLGTLGEAAQVRIKQDAFIDEVYGKAGYRDAAERFFNPSEEEDQRIVQMTQAMQQMQTALQEAEKALADKQGEQRTRIEVARINVLGGLAKQEMSQKAQQEAAFVNAAMNQVAMEGDREFQREQGEVQHGRSMEMQQAKQIPMQGGGEAGESMGGRSIHELLGLQPPADPAETMAPLVQTLAQGFQILARQMQQQTMMLARQMQQQQAQTAQQMQESNQQLIAAVTAPKRVVRGPDGFAQGVVVEPPRMMEN